MPVIEQLKKDNLTAYIEHGPGTGEPLMLRTSTGMQSLYVYDGTGNPAALLTSGEYVAFAYSYNPYGKPALTENSGGAGVPQNPYTFKVGLQDRATGWVKYGQRWYSPGIGRWTQMDTLDTPLDPGNANRYAYAAIDPINNSDPLGLFYGGVGADACFIFCVGLVTADGDSVDIGLTTGLGPRVSAGAGFVAGLGQSQAGSSSAVECTGGLLGMGTLGASLAGDDLYVGGGIGPGAGCSFMWTNSGQLF